MQLQYVLNKGGADFVFPDGTHYTFSSDDAEYEKVKELIRECRSEGNFTALSDFVAQKKRLLNRVYKQHPFKIEHNLVYIDGEALPSLLSERLIKMAEEDADYAPLVKFWERLRNNPSSSSVAELYDLLSRNHHALIADGEHIGCFLAYKYVTEDYKDIHSRTFDNSVGKTVSIERRKVDDNRRNECSYGLHVGSWEYVKQWAHSCPIIDVIVDPADVVSVPLDENAQKCRTCKYIVLRDTKGKVLSQVAHILEHIPSEWETPKEYDYNQLNTPSIPIGNDDDDDFEDDDEDTDSWDDEDDYDDYIDEEYEDDDDNICYD